MPHTVNSEWRTVIGTGELSMCASQQRRYGYVREQRRNEQILQDGNMGLQSRTGSVFNGTDGIRDCGHGRERVWR